MCYNLGMEDCVLQIKKKKPFEAKQYSSLTRVRISLPSSCGFFYLNEYGMYTLAGNSKRIQERNTQRSVKKYQIRVRYYEKKMAASNNF